MPTELKGPKSKKMHLKVVPMATC